MPINNSNNNIYAEIAPKEGQIFINEIFKISWKNGSMNIKEICPK